jgi:transcriptional pleiotropic regulator of transition state genes
MKATGIIKKIDDLGRIVIPKDIRKTLGVNNGDALQFFVEGDTVVLRKFGEECEFCGSYDNLTELKGKFICENCKKELC